MYTAGHRAIEQHEFFMVIIKGTFIIISLHYLFGPDKASHVSVDCESSLASIYSYRCSWGLGCRLHIYYADKGPLQQGQKCQVTLEQPVAVDPNIVTQYREPSSRTIPFCNCGTVPKFTCGSSIPQISLDRRMPGRLADALASQWLQESKHLQFLSCYAQAKLEPLTQRDLRLGLQLVLARQWVMDAKLKVRGYGWL